MITSVIYGFLAIVLILAIVFSVLYAVYWSKKKNNKEYFPLVGNITMVDRNETPLYSVRLDSKLEGVYDPYRPYSNFNAIPQFRYHKFD